MTSDVLVPCLKAYTYDFWAGLVILTSLVTLTGLMFLKYLEIWLTSFWDLAGIGGGIFSILTGTGLSLDL